MASDFLFMANLRPHLKIILEKLQQEEKEGGSPLPRLSPPPSEEEVIFLELHQTTTKWCVDCTNNQFLSMNQLVIVAGASSSLPPLTVPKLVKMPIFLVGWLVG